MPPEQPQIPTPDDTTLSTSTAERTFSPSLSSSPKEDEDSGKIPTQAFEYDLDTPQATITASSLANVGFASYYETQGMPTRNVTEPNPVPLTQNTWANVAALPKTTVKQPGTTINVANKKAKMTLVLKHPVYTHEIRQSPKEPSAMQNRVVFIRNCEARITLRKITATIEEGPLMSIVLETSNDFPPQMACIIFYAAKDALEFKAKIEKLKLEGRTLYGPQATVISGPAWPEDDDIRSMHSVEGGGRWTGERRRLTFAGPGTFDRVSRADFVKDNVEAVGPRNIELIWLFNKGNATVIYTSVRVARTAKKVFMDKAKNAGLYQGLKVVFSMDPCQRALKLITQMHDGPETKGLAIP